MGLSKYHEAFQEHLAGRFDYVPHADPNKTGLKTDDHQQAALKEVYEGLLINHKRMCAVGSCGSGKTLVEIAAILASQEAKKELDINGDRKDLIVTEGRTVVTGIRKQFQELGIQTGIWSGGKKELEQPVIVAGIHALSAAHSRRELAKLLPQGTIDLCVIDEVDRFLTKPRKKIIDLLHPRIVTSFTATEEWPDGRHISDAYGPVVHRLPLLQAMREKINVVPELFIYESEINESDLKIVKDDYDPVILQAAWKHAEIHKSIPDVYRHLIPENLRYECPTLVYVPSKDLVQETMFSLQEAFPDLTIIGLTGKDPTSIVETTMESFRDGDVQIIVLCEMGGRGMNLENAKLLIDGYPTKSLNKLEQRHGRVLRKIRSGSPLWKKGWRKNDAIIAQIIPKANTFRPAFFTDIIGGWKELKKLKEEGNGEGGTGAPKSDLISQIRAHIESKNPPHRLSLIRQIDILEEIKRDKPRFDVDGFFRIPRRYTRKDKEEERDKSV